MLGLLGGIKPPGAEARKLFILAFLPFLGFASFLFFAPPFQKLEERVGGSGFRIHRIAGSRFRVRGSEHGRQKIATTSGF